MSMSLFACVFLLNDLLMFVCLLCLQLLLPSGSPRAGVWSSQIFRLMVTLYTFRERATRRRTWWSSCIRWDVRVCVCVCVWCVCACVFASLSFIVSLSLNLSLVCYMSLPMSCFFSKCQSPPLIDTFPRFVTLPFNMSLSLKLSVFSMCHPSQCVTLPLNVSLSLWIRQLPSICHSPQCVHSLSLSVSLSWLRLSVPWRTVHPGHWSEEVPPAGGVHGRGHSSRLCRKVPLTAEDPLPDLSTK